VRLAILDLFGGSGGVGRCTREILRQLNTQRVPTMLCGQSHVVDSFKDHRQETPNIRFTNLESPKLSFRSTRLRLLRKCESRSSRLPTALLRETISAASTWGSGLEISILVNYPQVMAPPSGHDNIGIFLHDLNWRLYPGNFQDPDRTDRNCRGWVARASRVITNSETTRDEVIQHYRCASAKVVAAPLAPFDERVARDFDASKYLVSLGLNAGQFFLFPGVWGMHKGHDTLTEAIEMSQGTAPVVVTCGKPVNGTVGDSEALAALRGSLAARWDRLITEKKLVVVGGVSEPEMQALRVGCRAYVLPSQYEGFGFPLAEAIYQHRPAIVSDIKAHQEILQRYSQYKLAKLFPPSSSSALLAELNRVSSEPTQEPMSWPKTVAATWSWKDTAQRILLALSFCTA
jgi:hypothetical protein